MTSALDLAVLKELANNDPAMVRKYSLLFVASLEEVLQQIDEGMVRADIALLGAMGHRAKSTAWNIGAADLANQCLQLEEAAKARDASAAMALAQSLRPMFLPVRAELLAQLQG